MATRTPPGAGRRVALIADTHLPQRAAALPAAARRAIAACDLVIHAGDHSDLASLRALRAIGPPLVAVRGNVEEAALAAELPETAMVTVAGVSIGVIHDAGREPGREARLRRRFPAARLVVFGHSHIPYDRIGGDGLRAVNPGSPTDRRRQPRCTMAIATLAAGQIEAIDFLAVDDPAGPLERTLVRR